MLRMTRTRLIVYIEGKENDPVFYSEIAEQFSKTHGVETAVWRSQELPGASDAAKGGSGGKYWMIRAGEFWIRYINRRNRGIGTRLIFALDTDLDHIRTKKITDPHFVYTQGCTVENYFVQGNDIKKAAERALSLIPNDLSSIIGTSQQSWIRSAAQLWKEWIWFCVVASQYRHSGKIHGYSQRSRVNSPFDARCDSARLLDQFEALRLDVKVPAAEFDAVKTLASAYVDNELAAGREHSLMKGEWFIDILVAQIESNAALRKKAVNSGKHGVWSALRSSLSVDPSAHSHYEQAFLDALNLPA
jgi:hypothetical protein